MFEKLFWRNVATHRAKSTSLYCCFYSSWHLKSIELRPLSHEWDLTSHMWPQRTLKCHGCVNGLHRFRLLFIPLHRAVKCPQNVTTMATYHPAYGMPKNSLKRWESQKDMPIAYFKITCSLLLLSALFLLFPLSFQISCCYALWSSLHGLDSNYSVPQYVVVLQ